MRKLRYFVCILVAFTFFHITHVRAEVAELAEPIQKDAAVIQTQMETQVFNLINQSRENNSLPPLTWSNTVATQARTHSINMANKTVPFGHQGMEVRYANLRRSIPGLTRFGENVAWNMGYPDPAATAVSGWLKSSGHYANIMGDYNLTGVGVAKDSRGRYYFTQIFVKASSRNRGSDVDSDQNIEEISEQCILDQIECVGEAASFH